MDSQVNPAKNTDRRSTRTLSFGFTDVPYFISVTVYHDQFHIHKFVNIFFNHLLYIFSYVYFTHYALFLSRKLKFVKYCKNLYQCNKHLCKPQKFKVQSCSLMCHRCFCPFFYSAQFIDNICQFTIISSPFSHL